jgi:nicotinate phosphoribosyltransferase
MKLVFRDPVSGRLLDNIDIVEADTGKKMGGLDAAHAIEAQRSKNYTMDTDLYELTMAAGYKVMERTNQRACFDLYYRQNPDDGAFCIFAGLESVIRYINNLSFYPDDIQYLRSLGFFPDEALEYLSSGLRFTGDVWAIPEGSVVFPNEPLIRIVAPIAEAQVLETTLLALVGHQTLIATKAARLCIASRGAPVVDFGTRRAHGVHAALYGARAAYIGGVAGTSNVKAGKMFGIPVKGTHAHSWVESFDTEIEAFDAFVKVFPENSVLLVDTYDTLQGIANAIEVAKRMRSEGRQLKAIRIDSGDLAYYSKEARGILDQAGFEDVQILVSGDLDEWLIESLRDQGARVDVWCVGTRLMTSYQTPALGVVYKLMAADSVNGPMQPKIKISQNPRKVTNPGLKKIIRFYNGKDRMIGDLLTSDDEPIPKDEYVRAHHPMYDYMKKVYKPPYKARELMIPVFIEGKQVYDPPGLEEIRKRATRDIERLEPEYKRFSNPHIYKVSLSDSIYRMKKELLNYYQDTLQY